jgi:hypothetical protein
MSRGIIKVKYESDYKPKVFEGKGYSYYTNIDVIIGDYVIAPTVFGDKVARVTEINISEDRIESIKPYIKTIKYKVNKTKFLQEHIILEDAA